MFSSQASAASSDRMTESALWESPSAAGNSEDGTPRPSNGSLSVSNSISFLRRNAKRIVMLALAVFAIGFAVLMVVPVRYAATALVVVDPREQRVTSEQDVLPGIGQDAAALQSLIEIAKSDGFLRPLIQQLNIANDEEIAAGETDVSRLLDKFRGRLDISRRGLTYVVAITFISNRPQQAAYYANAVADGFVASQSQVRKGATDEAAGWLNSRLKNLSDRLRESEDAVAAFKLDHKILNAGKDSTTQQLRVTELSQQVAAARLRAEEAKTRYEQAQRDLKANVEGPIKQDLLGMLRAQRSQLNDQIAQKRAVLGDRHPDLVISANQLSELNRQIETERKRNIESGKSEYESLLEQQKSLERQLKSVEAQMLLDGQASVRLQELQRDAEANKNIYEQFLARYKTTNEQRLLQSSQTKIVSAAIPPTRPTRPPLPLILAALAVASILTSSAIAAIFDRREKSVRPAEQSYVSETRRTEIVKAPSEKTARTDILNELAREAPKTALKRSIVLTGTDPSLQVRGLLETIAGLPGPRGKVALITSARNDVGKSAIARSLNSHAVDSGMLSALIEVQPASSRAGQPSDGENVPTWLRATRMDIGSVNLLFASQNDDIRSEFDLIVIDAPSVAEHPEVASISASADLSVLVDGRSS